MGKSDVDSISVGSLFATPSRPFPGAHNSRQRQRECAPRRARVRRVSAFACACCAMVGLSACEPQGDADPRVSSDDGICRQTTLQNCGAGPWDPFGIALAFAWYSGQCTEEVVCPVEPPQTNFADGIVTNDFIERNWTTSVAVDTEPNDSTAEARPFVVRARSGLLITGTVNDATDPADFIAVSFEPASYTAYLCRSVDVCVQPWLQSDDVYLELWDQNELVIQTTNMMHSAEGHAIAFQPSQGLRYFISVHALDTDGADFQYKLVVTD